MGWRPSVRDSSGCQASDSTKKMEGTSSPVSCRSALTAPALNYSVSAPPSQPPPPHLLLSPCRSLQLVCVCSTRRVQRRKMGRKVGAGWREPTRRYLEVPRSSRNPHQCLSLWVQPAASLATPRETAFFSIPTEIADHFSERIGAISHRRVYLVTPNFMFYVYTLTNKVN